VTRNLPHIFKVKGQRSKVKVTAWHNGGKNSPNHQ